MIFIVGQCILVSRRFRRQDQIFYLCCLRNLREISRNTFLEFAPNHFVDDAGVALNELHDFVRNIFRVDGNGNTVVAVAVHFDGNVDGLQE